MYQNFIPGQYPSCFRGDPPVLSYIWKKRVGESFSPPRIMHSHDEISELLLVIEGSANYTVGESQYIIPSASRSISFRKAISSQLARAFCMMRMHGSPQIRPWPPSGSGRCG